METYYCRQFIFLSKGSKIPKWLNLAIGYGADGMITGNMKGLFPTLKNGAIETFLFEFDVDLTKIETKSHFFEDNFSVLNTLKIPAPTIEYSHREGFRGRISYFLGKFNSLISAFMNFVVSLQAEIS
jgi:hypothetical protein